MATTPTQAQIDQFIEDTYGGKKVKMNQADVDKVKQQILSQGLTSKWKGQGFGSAEANALDMAKELVASGVTDIKQVGQGTYYQPQVVQQQELYNGRPVEKLGNKYVVPQYAINGESGQNEIIGYDDVPADQVIKGYVVYEPGEEGNGVYRMLTADEQKKVKPDANGNMTVPVAVGQGIINKDTGERLLSNYNERTQGNAFGGTYAGSGNTAYRVQFDAQGNPYFYTTQHSSNDLVNMLQDNALLNTIANIGAAYFGGPAGTMALQAAQGKDIGDILKAGALSYAGGQAGSYLQGSEALVDALGQTGANIAANAAKSYVTSEGKIDPVAALLAGGMDAGVGAIIGDIPGFANLDKGTQALVTKAVSNTLRTGKLDPVSLAQAAFKAGTSAMANATNTPTEAQFDAANADFLKTLEPYLQSTSSSFVGEFAPETLGNVDENGKFVPDPLGSTMYKQLHPDVSGSVSNMKDWSFDQTSGQWTRTDPVTGETTAYDYKTPITGTAQTGADIEKAAGATPTTSTTSSTTKTTPTKTTTTTPTTPTATTPAALTAASWYGINPADLVKADKNDVAHIKSFKELFGHELYGDEQVPASSAQDHNVSRDDILQALEDTQNYAGGGDIHALLQLLRS